MGVRARVAERLEQWLTDLLTRLLTRPLRGYEQRVPNSLANLKAQLRKGDVILVEGDQRVSQVIKYLTTSSWSHTALYIGDELRRFDPELARQMDARFGADARHLILEADNDPGVTVAPLAKYVRFNIRVCRPRLHKDDVDRVVNFAFRHLGHRYNLRHMVELAKYLFPVSIIPRRFRQAVLHYGTESKHEVICSTLLARAFGSVGYPVLPKVTVDEIKAQSTFWRRLLGREDAGFRALYQEEDPAFITPRDFDLSPYFDIVKINYLIEPRFDYRQIRWAQEAPTLSVPELQVEPARAAAPAPIAPTSGNAPSAPAPASARQP